MNDIRVRRRTDGICADWGAGSRACAVGRAGIGVKEREGDGLTPIGAWPLRRVFYRADRITAPDTALPVRALVPEDGWCDAPDDPNYNRPVMLPYRARAEHLWRDDALYDLIAVLGFNDDPVVPGKGSAIFLHVARSEYAPTEGCIALARADLLEALHGLGPNSRVIVEG